MVSCRLCTSVDLAVRDGSRASWNQRLLESKHFIVVPTIGPLVEGWVLVTSKNHVVCMGEVAELHGPELCDIVGRTALLVRDCYGPVAIFEHGPSQCGQAVGCGVDHAHVHIVPTDCDLTAEASKIVPGLQWERASDLRDTASFYRSGWPYLYSEQPQGIVRIAAYENLPSQLFRRIIAAYVGRPNQYDWRRHPQSLRCRRTAQRLSGLTQSTAGATERLIAASP